MKVRKNLKKSNKKYQYSLKRYVNATTTGQNVLSPKFKKKYQKVNKALHGFVICSSIINPLYIYILFIFIYIYISRKMEYISALTEQQK